MYDGVKCSVDLLSLSGLFIRLWLIQIWLRIWGRGEKVQCNYLVCLDLVSSP